MTAELHYVPHSYTGIAVSMLFLGRLAFRLVQGYTGAQAPDASSMVSSPLTVAILFVLVGYYVCYYSWVLSKSKHLNAADFETDSAAPPVSGRTR